jgi:hypothetical protein
MPSYVQLTACNPQAFIEAGQTYQRMAAGFGRVRAAFQQGMAVLDGNWQGAAKDVVTGRGRHPDGGLVAGGQEADSTGQVLLTLGHALVTAQTSLRAAVAAATAADAAAAGKIGALAAGRLIATFGSGGGKAAAIAQEVASIPTGETKVASPGTAATIAARVASRADFGRLGPVERDVIDRVTAPTGIIGSEGLAEWTRRQKD